jgi:hypothetical protein
MRRTLFSLLLAAACGRATGSLEPVTYEADIRPLVEQRCQACHVSGGIAPFTLGSYDEVKAMASSARAAIEARRMPPFLAARGCTDYLDDLSLSDEEIARFGAWVDQGLQRGVPSGAAPMSSANASEGMLARVDSTLSMPAPYTVQESPDEYRCFVLDWPQTAAKYVTGLRVVPGNPKVVHHVIAYLATPDQVQAVMDADAADPDPGYRCFGGPGAGVRGWLGAWAPGGSGSMYPADTGLLVDVGSKVVLQVHYNVQSGSPDKTDQTQIQMALEDSVQRRAVLLLWTNPQWVDGMGMDIPAYQADVVHSFAYDPTPYLGVITRGALHSDVGLRLYSASLHQHLLGHSSRLEILRGDGVTKECLLDIPRWDFHWQRSYGFAKGKVFHPGDRLNVTCHWDNSAEAQPSVGGVKQTPRDVKWGEGTGDEMCLGILYVTE